MKNIRIKIEVVELKDLEQQKKSSEEKVASYESAKQAMNAEWKTKTADLYKQQEEINEKIEVVEEPYKKKEREINNEVSKIEHSLWDINPALNFQKGEAILKAGIKTKEQAIEYVNLCWGRKCEKVRELSHNHGKDVHAWAMPGQYADTHSIYFATGKNKLLSCLIIQKAQHVGDYTYVTEYGFKKAKDFNERTECPSDSRRGIRIKEWTDKELVTWKGLNPAERVKFWNDAYNAW